MCDSDIRTKLYTIFEDYNLFSSKFNQLCQLIRKVGVQELFEACPEVTGVSIYYHLYHYHKEDDEARNNIMLKVIDYLALDLEGNKDQLHHILCLLLWGSCWGSKSLVPRLIEVGAVNQDRFHEYVPNGRFVERQYKKIKQLVYGPKQET